MTERRCHHFPSVEPEGAACPDGSEAVRAFALRPLPPVGSHLPAYRCASCPPPSGGFDVRWEDGQVVPYDWREISLGEALAMEVHFF